MLRAPPALPPFAASAKSWVAELTHRGHCELWPPFRKGLFAALTGNFLDPNEATMRIEVLDILPTCKEMIEIEKTLLINPYADGNPQLSSDMNDES